MLFDEGKQILIPDNWIIFRNKVKQMGFLLLKAAYDFQAFLKCEIFWEMQFESQLSIFSEPRSDQTQIHVCLLFKCRKELVISPTK